MKKITNKFITETLRQAAELQARYVAMGAPKTQNVRNFLPMHELVKLTLPVLPKRTDLYCPDIKIIGECNGKKFSITKTVHFYLEEIYGGIEFWQSKALSVEDITAIIRSQGFRVDSEQHIHATLAKMNVAHVLESDQDFSERLAEAKTECLKNQQPWHPQGYHKCNLYYIISDEKIEISVKNHA